MLVKPVIYPKQIKVGSRVIRRNWILFEEDKDPKFNKYYNKDFGVYIAAGEIEGTNILKCMGIWNPETKLIYSNIYCLNEYE